MTRWLRFLFHGHRQMRTLRKRIEALEKRPTAETLLADISKKQAELYAMLNIARGVTKEPETIRARSGRQFRELMEKEAS